MLKIKENNEFIQQLEIWDYDFDDKEPILILTVDPNKEDSLEMAKAWWTLSSAFINARNDGFEEGYQSAINDIDDYSEDEDEDENNGNLIVF